MTREEAERLLRMGQEGVGEWNLRRREGEPIPKLRELDVMGADLTGIDLSGVRILGGIFAEATLAEANCRGAVLYGGYFASANLRGACLVDADLRHSEFGFFSIGLGHCGPYADLSSADLSRARLRGANLDETILAQTSFRGADLTRAFLGSSDLSTSDLSGACLDSVLRDLPRPRQPKLPRVHFGQWLRSRREELGLTPDELAAALGFGLTGYDVTTFMEKKSSGVADQELAARLSETLRVPVTEIPR